MAWLRMALLFVRNVFRDRGELALENLALRQQLAVLHGKKKRRDRLPKSPVPKPQIK